MKHVIACQEPARPTPDRWVMIAGEPGNWGLPSSAIYRCGLLEDAVNGLMARFHHDLTITEEPSILRPMRLSLRRTSEHPHDRNQYAGADKPSNQVAEPSPL